MENKNYKRDDWSGIWKTIGLLIMSVGGVMSFFRIGVTVAKEEFISYFKQNYFDETSSVALGLVILGFVIYLIGKEVRENFIRYEKELEEENKRKELKETNNQPDASRTNTIENR